MKRFLLFLIGLLLIPSLLFAQVDYSGKGLYSFITTNYHNITQYQAWVASQGYLTSANLTAYRLVVDSYSTSEVDTLLSAKLDVTTAASTYATITALNLKANSADVYTTAQVDLLLLGKLDSTALIGYYTALQVDALLLDKADTSTVALKIGRSDYFSDTLGGSVPPSGSTSGGTVLCDDGVFRSVASVGGGVTNAVDLNTDTSLFSRIMDGTAINAQLAFNQIDANAATTAEVAAKANTADVYTKSEVNATIEAAIAAIPTPSVNQTVNVTAGEDLTAGDVVSLINSYGTVTAKKNNLAVNTSPNGAESVFNSAATTYCSAVALDSTRFLVAYQDSDTYVHAVVGTVSGSSISWGTETAAFQSVVSVYVTACKIATDKVLVCYRDGVAFTGRMVVLTISSSTITVGTPDDFTTGNIGGIALTQLDTDKALVCYRETAATGEGLCKTITVSSTTPTPYPEKGTLGTSFTPASTANYISVSALSSTSAIVCYSDGGNSNFGTSQVLSISGTTITPGTEYVFRSGTTYFTDCFGISSTKAVITAASSGGRAYVATISGTEITYGTEANNTTTFNANYQSCAKISDDRFIWVWQDNILPIGNNVRNYIATINDTTITLGDTQTVQLAQGAYNDCIYLGSNKSVIVYQDTANSSYGTAVVNTWVASDYSAIRGLCTATTSSGASAPILLSGEATGLSSLVTGSQYWLQSDFSYGTNPVSLAIMKNSSTQTGEIFLGTAKSATTMWFNVDYK